LVAVLLHWEIRGEKVRSPGLCLSLFFNAEAAKDAESENQMSFCGECMEVAVFHYHQSCLSFANWPPADAGGSDLLAAR
jgi:hypothetical protein